jgi:hypothetical protein
MSYVSVVEGLAETRAMQADKVIQWLQAGSDIWAGLNQPNRRLSSRPFTFGFR